MTKYFDTPGKGNTGVVLELAAKRCREMGIREMVVATTTGFTAVEASRSFDGKVVAVTHAHGFRKPFTGELDPALGEKMRDMGVLVVTGTHALSGVEKGVSGKAQGMYPAEIVANTLRMFGQGAKVCVECVIMAADAGVLSGKPVMAVTGTGRGADTAMVITPAHAKNLFDLRVNEVICKPRLMPER